MARKPKRPNRSLTGGNIVCVRLTDDLLAAIDARAQADGLTRSEILRVIAQQWVYNTIPSVDEGYTQARSMALALSKHLTRTALEQALDTMPQTYEEAQAFFTEAQADLGRR